MHRYLLGLLAVLALAVPARAADPPACQLARDGRAVQSVVVGAKATDRTRALCPPKTTPSVPDAVSHNLTLPSAPAVANLLPSGAKAKAKTPAVCARNERCSWRVARFQSFT